MENKKKETILQILTVVEEDAENDVKEFAGKLFNGRNVAEFNVKQSAMIKALASILKEIVNDKT